MPPIERRLKLLDGLSAAVRAAILIEASADPGRDELWPLAAALGATGEPAAVAQVVRHVHKLSVPGWEMLNAIPKPVLAAGIRSAIAGRDRQGMVNAIELIRRSGDADFAGDLVDLLDVRMLAIAELAADALLEMVIAEAQPLAESERAADASGADSEAGRARLDRTMARAAEGHRRHRQERALLAIGVMSSRAGPKLRELLMQADHPIVLELRSLPGRIDEPVVRRMMLRWLVQENLRPQVSRWMSKLRSAQEVGDLLAHGHLIRAPQRRRALRRVERPAGCVPALDQAVKLPPRAQRHLPALVMAIDLHATDRIAVVADWITLPAAAARLQCVLALARQTEREAAAALERFGGDRDAIVAAAALRQVLPASSRCTLPAVQVMQRCLRGPDATVDSSLRRRAASLAAGSDLESFLAQWLSMPAADRMLAARQLLAMKRTEFIERVQQVISGGERDSVVAGVFLVRRLRLTAALEASLIRQIGNADPAIAASAAGALADCASPRSAAALRIALQYDDARVRANAIEALAARDLEGVEKLLAAMSHSRDNRARANAILRLVQHRPELGRVRLMTMLHDDDPRHRVSAIWVAGRSRDVNVDEALGQIAREDAGQLRERAEAALRLLCWNRRRGSVETGTVWQMEDKAA